MVSKDIIELEEQIKVLEKKRQTLENELDETIEYADYIARTDGEDGEEQLPSLEIEIERMRIELDMIDDEIDDLNDEIDEIKKLLGMDE